LPSIVWAADSRKFESRGERLAYRSLQSNIFVSLRVY